MRNFVELLGSALAKHRARQRIVNTPSGCEQCLYRQPGMREDSPGWCYMFKDLPGPTCAQFRDKDAP